MSEASCSASLRAFKEKHKEDRMSSRDLQLSPTFRRLEENEHYDPGYRSHADITSDLPEVVLTNTGIYQVADVTYAYKYVFSFPRNDLIIACGWPRGIHVFMATVLKSMNCNIVILALEIPEAVSIDCMQAFSGMCVWVKGSSLDITDLTRAGVLEAKSCCVFSTYHAYDHKQTSSWRMDVQAVLARQFIHALRYSDSMLERRTSHLERMSSNHSSSVIYQSEKHHDASSILYSPTSHDILKSKNATLPEYLDDLQERPSAPSRSEYSDAANDSISNFPESNLSVIVELVHSHRIEFLNMTPIHVEYFLSAQSQVDADEAWHHHGIYLYNPEYTSGRVLLEETLYGLVCFTLPMSRYCADSRIIDHLVSGKHMRVPSGLTPDCPVELESLPQEYVNLQFSTVFVAYLRARLKLIIAIYRETERLVHRKTPLDLIKRRDASQCFVITCPPADLILQESDRLYIIKACPKEALGLLFEAEQ